jgi:hypothetical protein
MVQERECSPVTSCEHWDPDRTEGLLRSAIRNRLPYRQRGILLFYYELISQLFQRVRSYGETFLRHFYTTAAAEEKTQLSLGRRKPVISNRYIRTTGIGSRPRSREQPALRAAEKRI